MGKTTTLKGEPYTCPHMPLTSEHMMMLAEANLFGSMAAIGNMAGIAQAVPLTDTLNFRMQHTLHAHVHTHPECFERFEWALTTLHPERLIALREISERMSPEKGRPLLLDRPRPLFYDGKGVEGLVGALMVMELALGQSYANHGHSYNIATVPLPIYGSSFALLSHDPSVYRNFPEQRRFANVFTEAQAGVARIGVQLVETPLGKRPDGVEHVLREGVLPMSELEGEALAEAYPIAYGTIAHRRNEIDPTAVQAMRSALGGKYVFK